MRWLHLPNEHLHPNLNPTDEQWFTKVRESTLNGTHRDVVILRRYESTPTVVQILEPGLAERFRAPRYVALHLDQVHRPRKQRIPMSSPTNVTRLKLGRILGHAQHVVHPKVFILKWFSNPYKNLVLGICHLFPSVPNVAHSVGPLNLSAHPPPITPHPANKQRLPLLRNPSRGRPQQSLRTVWRHPHKLPLRTQHLVDLLQMFIATPRNTASLLLRVHPARSHGTYVKRPAQIATLTGLDGIWWNFTVACPDPSQARVVIASLKNALTCRPVQWDIRSDVT
uniref:(northern house mosquito) hypothetical protein n=1 Tax=Culex pipiens TaxID=7175 RepID=A0A8D8IMB5_CULPI